MLQRKWSLREVPAWLKVLSKQDQESTFLSATRYSLEHRLAQLSRKLISTVVSGSARDSSGANVREVHFHSGGKVVSPGEVFNDLGGGDSLIFPWQESGWQWLDSFLNATNAVF